MGLSRQRLISRGAVVQEAERDADMMKYRSGGRASVTVGRTLSNLPVLAKVPMFW